MQFIQNAALVGFIFFALMIFLRKSDSYDTATQDGGYAQAWWVTVTTQQPDYEYLFGPFEHKAEAEENLGGYLRDLSDEGATQMTITIDWCKPDAITRDLRQVSV
ncbi:MAG: DUF1816 domain-containing protein [Thermosynechococcaceae cyanobacterium]